MCDAIYIVSNRELPIVPRDEARQAFHVADDVAKFFPPESPLGAHFGRRFIYQALHMRCGCGFAPCQWACNEETGETEVDDPPEYHAARRALADYLSDALRGQPAVEVFVCCFGDEVFPPLGVRRARPADFTRDYTLFETMLRQLVVVTEQDADLPRHLIGGT